MLFSARLFTTTITIKSTRNNNGGEWHEPVETMLWSFGGHSHYKTIIIFKLLMLYPEVLSRIRSDPTRPEKRMYENPEPKRRKILFLRLRLLYEKGSSSSWSELKQLLLKQIKMRVKKRRWIRIGSCWWSCCWAHIPQEQQSQAQLRILYPLYFLCLRQGGTIDLLQAGICNLYLSNVECWMTGLGTFRYSVFVRALLCPFFFFPSPSFAPEMKNCIPSGFSLILFYSSLNTSTSTITHSFNSSKLIFNILPFYFVLSMIIRQEGEIGSWDAKM